MLEEAKLQESIHKTIDCTSIKAKLDFTRTFFNRRYHVLV